MSYLTILDYTNGTTIIEEDPGKVIADFDYDNYIVEKFGKVDYHFMIGENIEIEL